MRNFIKFSELSTVSRFSLVPARTGVFATVLGAFVPVVVGCLVATSI
jgi:hypothetical protein